MSRHYRASGLNRSPLPSSAGLREALDLFFELNVWLALASIVMVGVTALTLAVPLSAVGVAVYLPAPLVYFAYVRDRRHVRAEDRVNHPRRTRLVEKYATALYVTEVLALCAFESLLALALPLTTVAGWGALALAHLPFAALFGYSRLKGLVGLDSLAVGGTWAYVVVFAVVVGGGAVTTGTLAVALAWTGIVVAGVESRNVEDASGDETFDADTLATRLGPAWTRRLEVALKAGGVAVFWSLGGPRAALLVVAYLAGLALTRAHARARRSGAAH